MSARLRAAFALLLALLCSRSARAVVITEYPLPANSTPNFLVLARDGSVVFTEYGRDKIGRIKNGQLTEVGTSAGCGPIGITTAANGRIFYACALKAAIGSVEWDLTLPLENAVAIPPTGPIVSGPDGNLWYTSGGAIVIVNLLGGLLSDTNESGAQFFGITVSGDGGVWAADPVNDDLYRFVSNGTGSISSSTFHVVPTVAAHPRQVTWCQGLGYVFASQMNFSKIVEAYHTGAGVGVGELPEALSGPAAGVVCGLDGTLWYTVPTTNMVGRITAAGVLEEFPVPTAASTPYGLVMDPDGSVWFTENGGQKIGHLRLRPQGDVDGNGQVNVADVFYLINFLFAGGPAPVP
jgi:virginiamycin B lyase